MSYDEYEKETAELGAFFWISLVLGFAFPLVWFLTAMAFYDFWDWENKKSEHEKKYKPKIGFLQKIKNTMVMIFEWVVIITIIGVVVFLFLR